MMGDIEVMGDGGLEHLRRMRAAVRAARCNISTNARCFDFAWAAAARTGRHRSEQGARVIDCLRAMNVTTTDTCINYQTIYQPHFGEHLAWGDTGTVIWANSVCGARTNFEGGPSAHGGGNDRTYAGIRIASSKRAAAERSSVEVDAELADLADWGALGKLVGNRIRAITRCRCSPACGGAPTAG